MHIHCSRDVSTLHHVHQEVLPTAAQEEETGYHQGPDDLTGILFGRSSIDQVNAGIGLVQHLLNFSNRRE